MTVSAKLAGAVVMTALVWSPPAQAQNPSAQRGVVIARTYCVGCHAIDKLSPSPLKAAPAFALLGGLAIYLLAHVAFRYRHIHTINRRRTVLALILFAMLPVALEIPSLATVAIVAVLLTALIVYETRVYGESRQRVRHLAAEPGG